MILCNYDILGHIRSFLFALIIFVGSGDKK